MSRKHIVVLKLLLLVGNIFPQEASSKILFLDFNFVKGEPSLVEMTVVDGKLKVRKNLPTANNGIQFSVLSSGENVLYQNIIDDPSECVYEYPAEEGKIGRASVKKDTINFSLRVPYSTSIDKIRINVLRSSPTLNKSQVRPNGFEFIIDHNKIQNRK